MVEKVMFLASVLTYRIGLLGRPIYSLGGDVLPMRAPLARLASPCSPAARPLRAGALFAQEGGVRPSRRRRRCRQPAADSSPGANLPWLSHQPSAPRYTSGAIRAARPTTRSFGWSQNLKMLHVLFPDGTVDRPCYETTFLYKEDGAADLDTFEKDVIAGFAAPDRFLPSKYIYDDAGSGTCRCRVCLEWRSAWGLEPWRQTVGGAD